MPTIDVPRASGGWLSLIYEDLRPLGSEIGPPVLLIHGFASSRRTNWISPSWYRTFAEAGRRVIAFDHRGHGESEVSHDPADYDEGLLAADGAAVLAACDVSRADVVGYSMGAMVAIRLALDHPALVRRLVLGGLGDNYLEPPAFMGAVPEALLADDPSTIADAAAKMFRTFADAQKQDRRALAACWRQPRMADPKAALRRIACPTLIAIGEADRVTGPADRLVSAIPQAILRLIPRRDHMSAVGDRVTKAEVLSFLSV